jgi:hypothetical protein
MTDRPTIERRKKAPEARVDVTRGEYQQLSARLERLADAVWQLEYGARTHVIRIAELQRDVHELKGRRRASEQPRCW